MRMPIGRKMFLSHFLAVLLVSGSIGTYFYLSAVDSLTENVRLRLESSAALIAQVVDAASIENLRKEADRSNPDYAKSLRLVRALARTNPDIAFVYIMRQSDGRVYFVVDSDESEEQAMPGQEYPDHTPFLLKGFQRPSSDDRVYEDQWGSFMSGYAPLRNGNGEYLAGLDMRADELGRKLAAIRFAGALSLALSIILALLFSRILSSHVTRPVHMLIDRCRAIAQGDPDRSIEIRSGDELEQLVDAFNTMSSQLTETRAQAESAQRSLLQSKELLEMRVNERTQALTEVNERLLHEVVERARAEEQLAQVARSDPLTGLMNRRAMLEQLEFQAARYARSRVPFAVILGDLDRFKAINDTFGHDVGDEALIHTGRRVIEGIRSQDMAARWGGEEFLILLPGTDLGTASEVAERLRERIAAEPIAAADRSLALTMSIGVAAYGAGQTVNQCIKAADVALYRAKLGGRDRVVAAPLPAAALDG